MSYPWKDYFSFTRRERTGIIILIIIIFLVNILPVFFYGGKGRADQKDFNEFQTAIAALKILTPDSARNIDSERTRKEVDSKESSGSLQRPVSLFPFDPNTINGDDWLKLGLRDKTIQTILHFRGKGGKFRRREDIAKIFGLSKDEYEKLLPYVHIRGELGRMVTGRKPETLYAHHQQVFKIDFNKGINHNSLKIDVNNADTASFISLPGIGSKLAGRIVYFRERLGGFYSVEQLREVYGIPDSTYLKIAPFLKCEVPVIRKLDINTVEITVLKNHPYIKWNIANAIINYRQQHGNFKSLDELLQINLINTDLLKKIEPYFSISE